VYILGLNTKIKFPLQVVTELQQVFIIFRVSHLGQPLGYFCTSWINFGSCYTTKH